MNLSSLAYRLARRARNGGFFVYVCADVRSYRQLEEEIAFFLKDARDRLWRFPAWEVLPYDRISPHHSIVAERFATLGRLLETPHPQGLLLTSLPAWLQRIAPLDAVSAYVWRFKVGDRLDVQGLKARLSLAGLRHVDRVLEPGEYAPRGGVIDLWPPTEPSPLRLDFFGDEIESIRRFDVESQRSKEVVEQFVSTPSREIILDEMGRKRFLAAFLARFPHLRNHPMLASARLGRPHPGIESLLPLAYEKTACLRDYLPSDCDCFGATDFDRAKEEFTRLLREQFTLVKMGREPILPPHELYAVDQPLELQPFQDGPAIDAVPSIEDVGDHPSPLHRLVASLKHKIEEGWRILLVGHGMGQIERLQEAVSELGLEVPLVEGLHNLHQAPIAVAIGPIERGFSSPSEKVMVLTGREVLGQRLPRRRGRKLQVDLYADLRELRVGDYVVHEDHGIGRYQGLINLPSGEGWADFLHLEYAGETSIYVPVEEFPRIHRYHSETPPELDSPGGKRWKQKRKRAKKDILALAHQIVAIEAARKKVTRPPYRLEGELKHRYEEFCARFPFEETDDQASAIDAVMEDLAGDRPMDRIICGDVGFGKTEVALRAAFVVAASGRQVALLAPTTVLAKQHLTTFQNRFAGTGLAVAGLTRLQSTKEAREILGKIEKGEIHLIIGTHKLLSTDLKFKNLGLLIVDEEHRFGVKQKEKLKQWHHGIDLLSMTATPIPRTLNQALSGLRKVSIIATPPAERESVRTLVSPFDEGLALEAIRRELYRGGQVYYVHNHIGSIDRIARWLKDKVPEAELGTAHGRMHPAKLEKNMLDFYEGRTHILVCTTIIESGLDVPNANTLIVERADLLGLAQLHQIRGRVGRSHQQAYAIFFTPDERVMTKEAKARLQAIHEFSELGAGFLIARQDMEIRGAGNLLGPEQSGHIEAVGLDLYLQMLEDALEEIREGKIKQRWHVDIELGLPAVLPPNYIPQAGERLCMYRRIAEIDSDEEADALAEEMHDRFGPPPTEARHCLRLARLRWRAKLLGIDRIRGDGKGIHLRFTSQTPLEPLQLLTLVHAQPSSFRLSPDGGLSKLGDFAQADLRVRACLELLDTLIDLGRRQDKDDLRS